MRHLILESTPFQVSKSASKNKKDADEAVQREKNLEDSKTINLTQVLRKPVLSLPNIGISTHSNYALKAQLSQ